MLESYAALAFVVFFVYYIISTILERRRCNLPGPWGLPLVGYVPFLNKFPFVTFTKLAKTYGNIFQLQVGSRRVIVLNTLPVIHEAYSEMNFTVPGRPDLLSLQIFASTGRSRFAFKQPDARWRFLRRSAIKSLGLFASSKNSKLQDIVDNAEDGLFNDLDKSSNSSVDPAEPVLRTVAHVVGSVLFGVEYDRDHPLLKKLVQLTDQVSSFISIGGLIDNIPFAPFFLRGRIDTFVNTITMVNQFVEKHIDSHEFTGGEDDIRDVADALWKIEATTPAEEKKRSGINEGAIPHTAADLFGAGFGTTMESTLWILNLLAYNRHVQEKLQEELDCTLKAARPRLDDKSILPYTEAVVAESLRFASLIPLGLPHAVTRDTVFRGYKIPAGSMVFANLWGLHRDPNVFPQPFIFKPNRFIKADGQFDMDLAAKTLPFGTGRRRCVGENLARQELFLLTASIFQRYSVRIAPGVKADPHDAGLGFTRRPKRWELLFTARN